MSKKVRQAKNAKSDLKLRRYLIAIPFIAFIIKLFIISNIATGSWPGADGENYVAGVIGLTKEGFFSTEPKLSFWPAGYPILMWPFAEINSSNFFYFISVLQSILFGYSTFFMTREMSRSALRSLALPVTLIITLNPTLSLNSLSVGYESPIAACFMMVIGFALRVHRNSEVSPNFKLNSGLWLASWLSLAIFMQPRFLLVGFFLLTLIFFKLGNRKLRLKFISVSVLILLLGPAILIVRNNQVKGTPTISTNLGVTMAIGAGPETTGSYIHEGPEVPCDPVSKNEIVTDNQRVVCVIKWYSTNPAKTVKLAFNKSLYFWSPWSGPLADGTMARNPWLKISPAYTISKNQDGSDLVLGPFGRLISYLWIIGQVFFLAFGFISLRRRGGIERDFARLLIAPVLISWIISLGTIGDHRFRIPTMSLSLALQVAGAVAITNRISKATSRS
jgi:hypothetical protein